MQSYTYGNAEQLMIQVQDAPLCSTLLKSTFNNIVRITMHL